MSGNLEMSGNMIAVNEISGKLTKSLGIVMGKLFVVNFTFGETEVFSNTVVTIV